MINILYYITNETILQEGNGYFRIEQDLTSSPWIEKEGQAFAPLLMR